MMLMKSCAQLHMHIHFLQTSSPGLLFVKADPISKQNQSLQLMVQVSSFARKDE